MSFTHQVLHKFILQTRLCGIIFCWYLVNRYTWVAGHESVLASSSPKRRKVADITWCTSLGGLE